MAAKKLTPQEIQTLKIFSAYASKTGDKMGSKGYNARLADLTSNIRYEMAKTPKPAATKPAATKPAVKSDALKNAERKKKLGYALTPTEKKMLGLPKTGV